MKLSDFSIEDLKKMKQACIDTRAKYDGYWKLSRTCFKSRCPLCKFAWSFEEVYCEFCPWVLFEGERCHKLGYQNQRTYTRRKRLDHWIKLIDEEIRRRG